MCPGGGGSGATFCTAFKIISNVWTCAVSLCHCFQQVEKRKFDMEVSKWDDNGKDIIVLAKHMCLIMMEMTDFTRGRGNIKFYIL